MFRLRSEPLVRRQPNTPHPHGEAPPQPSQRFCQFIPHQQSLMMWPDCSRRVFCRWHTLLLRQPVRLRFYCLDQTCFPNFLATRFPFLPPTFFTKQVDLCLRQSCGDFFPCLLPTIPPLTLVRAPLNQLTRLRSETACQTTWANFSQAIGHR